MGLSYLVGQNRSILRVASLNQALKYMNTLPCILLPSITRWHLGLIPIPVADFRDFLPFLIFSNRSFSKDNSGTRLSDHALIEILLYNLIMTEPIFTNVCVSILRARREVPEPAERRLQTRRMPLWNALDCFITENLVLPVMYDSVHSVLVKQHGYIQWTNCTKNTLLGN